MAGVAIDYINSAIAKVNMPDIEGLLKFTYHLSQIKIEEFNILNLQMSFNSHHLINLVSIYREYQEKCQLNYQVKIKEGFIHVSKSGTVDVTIGSTSVDAFVGISSLNVNPNISNSSCTANFNIFDIKLHGSLSDDMNDLFRKEIEKHFKEKIEVICQVIERVESDQEYQNDPKIPKSNYVIHPYNTNKYLCIDLDGDRVLDSAAYAFELSKLSHLMINDNILKLFQQSIRNFFQCSHIDGLFIGELIPEKFHFNSTSKYVNTTGNVIFRTATPDGFTFLITDDVKAQEKEDEELLDSLFGNKNESSSTKIVEEVVGEITDSDESSDDELRHHYL
uniref:BPI1 domain-containing protein n=1 Tax=Strongyloides venezuelensis TaxID=75913 RepID=A0A0K0FQ42_STRVS